MTGPGPRPADGADPSAVTALLRLRDALRVLDGTDPDHDSNAFDRATDTLISVARALVAAAEPLLAAPALVGEAVAEAAAFHRDPQAGLWRVQVRACAGLPGAGNEQIAAAYEALLPAVTAVEGGGEGRPAAVA